VGTPPEDLGTQVFGDSNTVPTLQNTNTPGALPGVVDLLAAPGTAYTGDVNKGVPFDAFADVDSGTQAGLNDNEVICGSFNPLPTPKLGDDLLAGGAFDFDGPFTPTIRNSTNLRTGAQILQSGVYDDTLTVGDAESSALTLEDDLNYLRSVIKDVTGETNWFDSPAKNLAQVILGTNLATKNVLYRVQKSQNVQVPLSQNWVELTGVGFPPADPIATGPNSQGAVAAVLSGSTGAHDLAAQANNSNIIHVRVAATNDKIFAASGREIFGLLQVGNLATDGNAFGLSGDDLGQLSFVTVNPVTEALEAAVVGDIENTVIEYAYTNRANWDSIPETGLDNTFVSADIEGPTNLDALYNVGSDITVDTGNVRWDLTDGVDYLIRDSLGMVEIFKVAADAGGDLVSITGVLDVDNTNPVDVNAAMRIDSQDIKLAVVAGQISYDNAGGLTVEASSGALSLSGSGNSLLQSSAGEVQLQDLRTALLELSDVSNSGLFGGATSLLGAINAAGASGPVNVTKGAVTIDSNLAADATVNAANTTQLADAPNGLVPYTNAAEFVNSLKIFLNGQLLSAGLTAGTNNDVYPNGVAANGEMSFEFPISAGDILTVVKMV
jgi:hypothetical protein